MAPAPRSSRPPLGLISRPPGETAAPIGRGDLFTWISDPAPLERGDWWREAPCLLCGQAAGNAQVRVVSLVATSAPADVLGRLPASSWIIHAFHPTDDHLELHRAAHVRMQPGCACPWPYSPARPPRGETDDRKTAG